MNLSLSKLQTMRPQATAFALLGLHPTFDLDPELLERHYHIMMQELHPDRFVGKSAIEVQTAQLMCSWANQAYDRLKDKLLRAREILVIKQILSSNDEAETLNDPEILMEAMEKREQLDEINTTEQLNTFINEIEKSIESCEHNFQKAFESDNAEELMHLFLRLTYDNKLLADVHKKLNTL